MAKLKLDASLKERTAELLKDPDLLEVICGHVASGGTMIDLAETWKVRFGDLSNWIHAEKTREQRYMSALNDRGEWATERVLKELRTLAFSDLRELFASDGSLLPPDQWPDGAAQAVAAIETDELFEGAGKEREQIGFTKKIKLWDKSKSLEMLAKNLKLLIERHEHSGVVKLEDLVVGSLDPKPGGSNDGSGSKP